MVRKVLSEEVMVPEDMAGEGELIRENIFVKTQGRKEMTCSKKLIPPKTKSNPCGYSYTTE